MFLQEIEWIKFQKIYIFKKLQKLKIKAENKDQREHYYITKLRATEKLLNLTKNLKLRSTNRLPSVLKRLHSV